MPVNVGGAAGAGTPRGPRDREGTVHVLAVGIEHVGAAAGRTAASAERVELEALGVLAVARLLLR